MPALRSVGSNPDAKTENLFLWEFQNNLREDFIASILTAFLKKYLSCFSSILQFNGNITISL